MSWQDWALLHNVRDPRPQPSNSDGSTVEAHPEEILRLLDSLMNDAYASFMGTLTRWAGLKPNSGPYGQIGQPVFQLVMQNFMQLASAFFMAMQVLNQHKERVAQSARNLRNGDEQHSSDINGVTQALLGGSHSSGTAV
ncbi:MAG: hypothetical protein ACRC35_02185 [Angustibacter sp.]